VNDEWVLGEKGGDQGMFPADFVDSIPDSLPLQPKDVKEDVKVSLSCCA